MLRAKVATAGCLARQLTQPLRAHLGGTRRCASGSAVARNVGIIAHIDAGKTTTTERMLLLSGVTRAAGSVDAGDTVMDFMEQERERGITIQAAATSFEWAGHAITLIDTPGHVDFTIEVERTVRVLDGAVLIVDAVAGAQAQTETVWRQARSHGIPAVGFVNKMDREGASFDGAIASLDERLGLTSLPVQMPLLPGSAAGEEGGSLRGVVDLVELAALRYAPGGQAHGGRPQRGEALAVDRVCLADAAGGEAGGEWAEVASRAAAARAMLVERVAELDPEGEVAELYLEEMAVDAPLLRRAIRELTRRAAAVPVLCGASLHGVGVEPLLDAICAYLPSPDERGAPTLCAGGGGADGAEPGAGGGGGVALGDGAEAVALAFKVAHDAYSKKPLVWMRVYSGEVCPGDALWNARTGEAERPTRLLQMHGEDTLDVGAAGPGSIVAAHGLKHTRTGDTLLLRPREGCERAQLPGLHAPSPVFFCAVETHSSSQQPALDAALAAIVVEDPSVAVSIDRVTGQQLLGGMGELHLQVVAERLRSEHKLRIYTGEMQVAYREGICRAVTAEHACASQPGRAEDVFITLALEPQRGVEWAGDAAGGGRGSAAGAEAAHGFECGATEGVREHLTLRELTAALQGLEASAQHGELGGYPLYGARAKLLRVVRPKGAGPEVMRQACAEALATAVASADPVLLEPVMRVELRSPERHVGGVLRELTGKRRADVQQLVAPTDGGAADTRHVVQAEVPLASLVGYANALRSATQGEAALSMELSHYRAVDAHSSEALLSGK